MASKGYPADILTQVTEILAACKQIDSEMRPAHSRKLPWPTR